MHELHEIDRYLNKEMEGSELEAFEQLLLQDAGFRARVNEQLEFRGILKAYQDRRLLIDKMDRLESLLPATRLGTEPLKPGTTPIVIRNVKSLWISMAAAALVALLIVGPALWYSGMLKKDNSGVRYREMKRSLENLTRSQNAIINTIKTINAPVNPGTFGGTGFAVSSNGLLATNYHVVENADSIYVQDDKGEVFKVKLIYQDPVSDLAVLKIMDSSFRLPLLPYKLLNKTADVGEDVFTLGYPKNNIVYGKGYISAETGFRDDTSSYQVTLNVNPGNSGGPLLDNRGNVVGIVSGKQTPSNDIAFAVKSVLLNNLLDSLDTDTLMKVPMVKQTPLDHLSRVDQIKKLEDYIFIVKVYN